MYNIIHTEPQNIVLLRVAIIRCRRRVAIRLLSGNLRLIYDCD